MAIERLDDDLEALASAARSEERDLSLPPHSLQAEEAVLGSILKNPASMVRVSDFLRPEDFYQQRNRYVFRAMLSLFSDGIPIDYHSTADRLQQQGAYEASGGLLYLSELNLATPSAAHIEHYGRIVERTSIMRQLIAKAQTIAEIAYRDNLDPDTALEKAEQLILSIAEKRVTRDFRSLEDVLTDYMEQIEALQEGEATRYGIPTGYTDLDKLLGGFQRTDLIILAARTSVGKTSFALNLAVNAAVKHNATVAVFSLEMSAEQLASRLLSMESGVDSPRIRSAHLNEQESRKLDAAVNHLAKAPIWVDDTPSIPIMELRSKARRLAAEHTLDMIVVDYLQLIATDGGESRVQEIGQISRALKALARELRVPVLALSQLSRAVEQRTPHIPQLSDLRESGCLTGDTLIYLPDEGVQRRLDSLVGRVGFNVLALNPETWKLERRAVINSFPTGRKRVFLLRTRSGRTIRATSYHPFYTPTGWRRLDELAPGDRIAGPRKPPGPAEPTMSGSELALLGHLIGDGCTLRKHAVQYTTVDPSLASAVTDLAREIFGESVAPRIHRERSWYQVYLPPSFHLTHRRRNPVCEWLESLGVLDLRSYEKCVPDEVFRQPDPGIARFLRHLWATDGCVRVSQPRAYAFPQLYYSTSSPQLARDVHWLLLRLGIASNTREWPQKRGRPSWHINIRSRDHIEGFLSTVGVLGRQKTSAATTIGSLFAERRTRTHLDTIPVAAWDRETLTRLLTSADAYRASAAAIGHRYSRAEFRSVSLDRSATAAVASIMADDGLAALASSDVFWDEVDGIEPCGIEDVYDLTVQGLHNFVANGLIVKNSLEQDADVVVFIYRDEKYNPDTDKKGVADIIVAKHRNGPTGQVQLLFLERTTKFLDLEVYRS